MLKPRVPATGEAMSGAKPKQSSKRARVFKPVFDGRGVRATVTGMQESVVFVTFTKQKGMNRAALAAKHARMV